MKMKTGWMTALIAAAVSLIVSPSLAQGKGETVKFQDFPGSGNMLIRIAISKGYCEKYGIKCALQVIPSGPLGAQALLAGSIQSGMFVPEVAIRAIEKGAKLKAVTGAVVVNVFIAIAGNQVETPNGDKPFPAFMRDFKGKKVGVAARGSGGEMISNWMLAKAGLKPEDVTYVAVGSGNTAYAAVTTKQVDMLMIFEPVGSMCEVLKTCRVIWRGAEDKQPAELFAMNGGSTSNYFLQSYIDQNPHVIEAVINAAKDADAFINNPANFKEVEGIASSYFKFGMANGNEVMETVLKRFIEQKAYVAGINRNAVKSTVDYLLETKEINSKVAVSQLVDDRAPQ